MIKAIFLHFPSPLHRDILIYRILGRYAPLILAPTDGWHSTCFALKRIITNKILRDVQIWKTHGLTHGRTQDGHTDGLTDEHMDGYTGGHTDEHMNRHNV